MAVSVPSRLAPSFTCVVIWWRVVARGELLLAGVFPFHRPAGLQRGEHAQVFGDHLLLAAEAAADAFGEHVHVASRQAEQVAELLLHDERRLRAGADMQAAVLVAPGDRAVGFEMDVLHARGGVGPLVHGVGLGEAVGDAADLAVDVDVDVAVARRAPCRAAPARPAASPRPDRRRPAESHTRPRAAGRPSSAAASRLRDHGGDTLADEAHDVVEHVGVVRIDQMILVRGRAVEPARHVLPGEDRDDARHGQRRCLCRCEDAGMGVRRAQHLQMQQARRRRRSIV